MSPGNPHRSVVDTRTDDERRYNMPYEPGVISEGGRLLWFGGTTALPLYHEHPHDPEVSAEVPQDHYEQGVLILQGTERILHGAGAEWSDVVLLDVFATSMEAASGLAKAAEEIMGPHFVQNPGRGWPSGTLALVSGLVDPAVHAEVRGVAVIPLARQ